MDYKGVERISLEVMAFHGCHTVILYGSWALGCADPQSDVDIICVREEGPAFRDARILDGIYLDAFIYPEADLATPQPPLLRVLGGVVLRETKGFGSALLAKLQELDGRGPAAIPDDERRVAVLWSSKMLERFRGQSGLEADYRRMQLLIQSLEDYFALRGAWFRGAKAAFAWLLQHDTPTYQRFERAAQPGASDAAFAELVHDVYGPFAATPATKQAPGLADRMARLVRPCAERKQAFLSMAQEWRDHGNDRYRLGLEDFEAYLNRVRRFEDPTRVPAGWVPGTEFWLDDGEQILAGVRLRFWLSPSLEVEGGHIGYDVRPSARGKGLGTLALRLALREAQRRGLERVRLTVDADNHPSVRIIEKCGGILSGEAVSVESGKAIRQYWVDLPAGG